MRFTQIALLSSPILAFTIPKGQTDGVYQVSYVDGQEIHTLVNQTDQTAQSSPSPGLSASAKFRPNVMLIRTSPVEAMHSTTAIPTRPTQN